MDHAGRHDAYLTRAADARLAVDLDQHLCLQDAEDLVGPVVTVEVCDLVGRHGLNEHDETTQPMLGAGHFSDLVAPARERHLNRTL